MPVDVVLDEIEGGGELGGEGGGGVAYGVEAAATQGAFGAKGGEDEVASGLDGSGGAGGVGGALLGRGEEVEDGAVVPEAVTRGGEGDLADVADEPVGAGGGGLRYSPEWTPFISDANDTRLPTMGMTLSSSSRSHSARP